MQTRPGLAVLVLVGSLCADAHAQSAEDKAHAEQLFEQARAHMQAGEYSDACPKLEASHKLDPALGTLFNLAHCYERIGRLASAWAHYLEVADKDSQKGRSRRAVSARERARDIESRIPRLVIAVPEEYRVPGLVIERNGQVVEPALLGVPAYVDGGLYEVVAMAPGYQRYAVEVRALDGQEVRVDIPRPEPDADAGEAAVAEPDPPGEGDRAGAAASERAGRARRAAGLGLGGAGLAAALSGLGLGAWARSSWNQAFDAGLCDRAARTCTAMGQEMTDRARTRADIATALVGVGAVAAATGVVLYLTAPSRERAGARMTLTPMTSRDTAGVVLTTGF